MCISYPRNVAMEQDDAQALDDTIESRWRLHAIPRRIALGSLTHFIANFIPRSVKSSRLLENDDLCI